MALNAITIAAIVAACWAHPQGQSYLAKIDKIDALSISCGNPCCRQPVGVGSRTLSAKPKLILVERIHDFDDLVEQVTDLVKEQPKVKAQLRKAKPLKPAEATTDYAQEWLDYWAALLDSLRNQEYANRLYAELQQTMAIIDALIQRQELTALMQEEMRREEEEFMVLMLMVNT